VGAWAGLRAGGGALAARGGRKPARRRRAGHPPAGAALTYAGPGAPLSPVVAPRGSDQPAARTHRPVTPAGTARPRGSGAGGRDRVRARAGPGRRRRLLRMVSSVLLLTGALALADAALTVAWMEPVTALRTKLSQDGLERDLRSLEDAGPTNADLRALRRAGVVPRARDDRRRAARKSARRVALLARSLRRRTADGEAVGRLRVPRLDLSSVIVKGSTPGPLRKGPGTFDQAPWPGERGTAAIAGHRSTYGAPFRDIDALRKGDAVTAEMPYATVRYRVEGHRIVQPDELSVLRRVGHDRIVLSACHPRFSASQRIVVFARAVDVLPRS
jgi:sortase A